MADTILQGEKITRVFFQGKTETKVLDGIDIEIVTVQHPVKGTLIFGQNRENKISVSSLL